MSGGEGGIRDAHPRITHPRTRTTPPARCPKPSRVPARGWVRPTLPFGARENCVVSGLLAQREDVSPLALACSHPGNPPLRGQSGHRSLCGQTLVAPRGSSVTPRPQELGGAGGPALPMGAGSSHPRAAVERGRGALPPAQPGRSLRAAFPVLRGQPLWGSRCFSEPGTTSRGWAGA